MSSRTACIRCCCGRPEQRRAAKSSLHPPRILAAPHSRRKSQPATAFDVIARRTLRKFRHARSCAFQPQALNAVPPLASLCHSPRCSSWPRSTESLHRFARQAHYLQHLLGYVGRGADVRGGWSQFPVSPAINERIACTHQALLRWPCARWIVRISMREYKYMLRVSNALTRAKMGGTLLCWALLAAGMRPSRVRPRSGAARSHKPDREPLRDTWLEPLPRWPRP